MLGLWFLAGGANGYVVGTWAILDKEVEDRKVERLHEVVEW